MALEIDATDLDYHPGLLFSRHFSVLGSCLATPLAHLFRFLWWSCELNLKKLKNVKNIFLHNQRRRPLGLLLFSQLTPDSVWQRWSTWSSLSRFHSWFGFFAFGVYCPYSSGFVLLPLIWFDCYTCWMSNLNVQDSIELVSEDRRSAILQERRKNLSKCKQGFGKHVKMQTRFRKTL